MEINEEFAAWLDGRTIGYSQIFDGWYWRGPGYDEGWKEMDEVDVENLRAFFSQMYN